MSRQQRAPNVTCAIAEAVIALKCSCGRRLDLLALNRYASGYDDPMKSFGMGDIAGIFESRLGWTDRMGHSPVARIIGRPSIARQDDARASGLHASARADARARWECHPRKCGKVWVFSGHSLAAAFTAAYTDRRSVIDAGVHL